MRNFTQVEIQIVSGGAFLDPKPVSLTEMQETDSAPWNHTYRLIPHAHGWSYSNFNFIKETEKC